MGKEKFSTDELIRYTKMFVFVGVVIIYIEI